MILSFKKLFSGVMGDVDVSADNPLPVAVIGGAGVGGDREIVTSSFRVVTAGTGTSVGDIVSCAQVYDVSAAPVLVATIWFNQTTGLALSGTPTGLGQISSNVQMGQGNVTASTQRVTLAQDGPEVVNSTAIKTAVESLNGKTGNSVSAQASFVRPADTVAYASGDLVANSTTAGSVAPVALPLARVNAGTALVTRVFVRKSGTSVSGASFRVHLFGVLPVVTNGDNGAFLPSGYANYFGSVDVTLDKVFSDGSVGHSVMADPMIVKAIAGATTVYALLEARGSYTPVSGETFFVGCDAVQD